MLDELVTLRVRFTTDVQRIAFGGRRLEGIRAGSVLEVPAWVADVLGEARLAEVVDEVGLQQLYQLLVRERRGAEPVQLPEGFYPKVRRALSRAQREEAQRIENVLRDVVNLRLSKLIPAALKSPDPEWIRNLTPEERLLFEDLKARIREFYSSVLEVRGRG
ncbi:MAG: hypothetical protein QXO17_07810 [Nitrososphaerota archaeon]|nr:DNA replication complex GINS family protein [Candidatus Calditenuis fumarioli]